MVRVLAQLEEAQDELPTAVPLPTVKGGVFRQGKGTFQEFSARMSYREVRGGLQCHFSSKRSSELVCPRQLAVAREEDDGGDCVAWREVIGEGRRCLVGRRRC